jgi:small subunit ribosomal protein S8
MSTTDPIADMLLRIRNAASRGLADLTLPHSRIKSDVMRVLKREGYIEDFKVQKEGGKSNIQVTLRGNKETRAITGLKRMSTPGRRRYVKATEIPRVLGGLGICILSTSSGVMSGQEARKKNVGGEILCQVW